MIQKEKDGITESQSIMEEFLGIPCAEQELTISKINVTTLKMILLYYFKDKVGEDRSNKKNDCLESLKWHITQEKK